MLKRTEKLVQKYKEIVADYEQITGIYQRADLFLGIDLCFHSVLKFNFQDRPIIKGWVETLVIGDTRTGKTATVTNLVNHFRLGEIITGENVSFAGLVGGIQQIADRRAVQWGKIPLADKRLIVIDEVSGLNIDDIGRMSGIRSSGIAEITKIQTERTLARTRQIWLSNPRRPQPMSAHSYGVLAVKDLIGRPEDIARFDVIVTCASGDVTENIYNKPHKRKKITYTSSICRNLILWAWSRQPSDIVILSETEKLILEYATIQGEKYSSGIPVVEPAEQRIKLAKLAVATAIRFFSTDENGIKVIVRPEHIDFIYNYLERIYSSSSFRYDEWSQRELGKKKIGNIESIDRIIENKYVIQLLESEIFNITDFQHIVGDRELANSVISTLRLEGCLKKTGQSVYKKTPAFIDYLRDRTSGMTDEEMKIDTEDVPF